MPDEIMFLAQGIEAAITSTEGIEATNELAGFEDHNLLDRNQNTLNKNGASATTEIRIDLGEVRACSALCLANTNCGTGGSYDGGTTWNIGLQYDDNWAFSSPSTVSLSPNGLGSMADEALFCREFTEASARYWKVYRYWQQNNTAFTGTILLGTPYKSDLPYNRPRPMRSSYGIDMRETPFGHRHSNLHFEDRKIWRRADFEVLSESDWDDIFEYLWQASKGGHYPCLFRDVDDSLNWIRVNAGRGTLDYQESLNHFFQAPFVFEQEF